MPVQYSEGILAEHQHTRTAVSLFDCSHMGQFRLKGAASAAALDAILPRLASTQKNGTCRYNFLTNESGGVIDDIIVYRVAADEFFIVVNAGTIAGDAAWIRSHLPAGVEFADESDDTAKLDLQGPGSFAALAAAGICREDIPRYFRFTHTTLNGQPILLSRTGYTGEAGVEIYVAADKAAEMWDFLLALPQVKPAGLGARDTLRLEMAYPLYGHELNTETTPVEAGFGAMLNLDHDFVGGEGVRAAARKELVGIALESRRAAREGTKVLDADNNPIGTITSGSFAPSVGVAVAMAYISPGSTRTGDSVQLPVGRNLLPGKIVPLPFYQQGTARQL